MKWELINKNHYPDNLSSLSRNFYATFIFFSFVHSAKWITPVDNLSFLFSRSPLLLDFYSMLIFMQVSEQKIDQNVVCLRAFIMMNREKEL